MIFHCLCIGKKVDYSNQTSFFKALYKGHISTKCEQKKVENKIKNEEWEENGSENIKKWEENMKESQVETEEREVK